MEASHCNIHHKSSINSRWNNCPFFVGLVHQQTCCCKQIKLSIKHLAQYWIHDCWWNLNICSNMFVTLHLKLQKMKFNILPFCGINVMFMEDFLQFSPVIDAPLCSTNIQPTFSLAKLTQKRITRKSIWENYIHHDNVILTKQSCSICIFLEKNYNWKKIISDFELLKTQFLWIWK
jgi:hypothetical protein